MNLTLQKRRATLGTALFALFGIVGAAFVPHTPFFFLAAIFYIALLWNDYHSIRYFSGIIPHTMRSQQLIDGALVILHILLAISLSSPLGFNVLFAVLMAVATLKYAFELPAIDVPQRLYRKIKIDALATTAATLAVLGVILGYPYWTMVGWTAILVATSVYIIYVRPLYPVRENDAKA